MYAHYAVWERVCIRTQHVLPPIIDRYFDGTSSGADQLNPRAQRRYRRKHAHKLRQEFRNADVTVGSVRFIPNAQTQFYNDSFKSLSNIYDVRSCVGDDRGPK